VIGISLFLVLYKHKKESRGVNISFVDKSPRSTESKKKMFCEFKTLTCFKKRGGQRGVVYYRQNKTVHK